MRDQDQSAHDAQTLDSATADQAHEQEKAAFPEMFSDKEDEDEDSEMSPAWPEENEEPPVRIISICFFWGGFVSEFCVNG